MDKLRQAARLALEALEVSTDWDVGAKGKQLQSMKAITALREALAGVNMSPTEQAEQEPVAWLWINERGSERLEWEQVQDISKWRSVPLYTHPVRTKDLSDEDLHICFKSTNTSEPLAEGWPGLERFARAVIAADREKNK